MPLNLYHTYDAYSDTNPLACEPVYGFVEEEPNPNSLKQSAYISDTDTETKAETQNQTCPPPPSSKSAKTAILLNPGSPPPPPPPPPPLSQLHPLSAVLLAPSFSSAPDPMTHSTCSPLSMSQQTNPTPLPALYPDQGKNEERLVSEDAYISLHSYGEEVVRAPFPTTATQFARETGLQHQDLLASLPLPVPLPLPTEPPPLPLDINQGKEPEHDSSTLLP